MLDRTAAGAGLQATPVAGQPTGGAQAWLLALLLLVFAFGYVDRVVVQTLGQAIKQDLAIDDFRLGLLSGLGFAIFYSVLGLPIARLAERRSRVAIISVSVALFSAMALLCGAAATFAQLLLARIGVGVGEAGVQSPAASLIGDYFPPKRRGTALAVVKLGSPLGSIIGAVAGGSIAHHYGWRVALMATAVPGIVLALLFALTLREPVRGAMDDIAAAPGEPPARFGAVARRMWRQPEFRQLIAGLALATMALYANGAFVTAFFMRVHHLTLQQAGFYFAVLSGSSASVGMLAAGYAIDLVGQRGRHWYGTLPAAGLLVAAPLYLAGYAVESAPLALLLQTLGGTALILHNVPTLVAFQNMVGPRMRATAAFFFFFVSTLVGIGFGPPLLGWISDLYAQGAFGAGSFAAACPGGRGAGVLASRCAAASAAGLRHATMTIPVVMLWGALHYCLAARALRREAEPAAG